MARRLNSLFPDGSDDRSLTSEAQRRLVAEGFQLYNDDCLKVLPTLPAASIDAIICDPPYGTTANPWDSIIPLDLLWKELKRLIKPRGAVVMTAAQPFTTTLISSNRKWFKYCWVWDKERVSGYQVAKFRPMMQHEDVVVFCKETPDWYPIMTPRQKALVSYGGGRSDTNPLAESSLEKYKNTKFVNAERYPTSIIRIKQERTIEKHPTQKCIPLMRYLVRTYAAEGGVVLDFCMGSGSTGVACKKTGRRFIGIEKDPGYFAKACKRIRHAEH